MKNPHFIYNYAYPVRKNLELLPLLNMAITKLGEGEHNTFERTKCSHFQAAP